MMFCAKIEPCSAAVHAPRDWRIGTTSLSIVLGRPTTVSSVGVLMEVCRGSAAVVLVSSPPIVCRTSTPSLVSCSAATWSGSWPSWTSPRLTQSATLVSLTRELPIGLPPVPVEQVCLLTNGRVTSTERPVSNPHTRRGEAMIRTSGATWL